jgi:glycyl-tRNA synthetase beta chain
MPNLLFELGCEEMPASAVDRATQDFLDQVTNRLTEAGLSFGNSRVLGTPRRIILGIDDIPERQPDRTEESRGPRAQAAFDSDGNPTKALEGFCRGQGITTDQVTTREDYVWITKAIPGKATIELLAEILPDSLKALKFDKTMRWGLQKARFVRPIRWILAQLDSELVSFELFNVQSGLTSKGHRFMAPQEFTPSSWTNHLALLREHFVEPDPAERRKRIISEAKNVATGIPDLPESLVNENVHLNEWPVAHEGTFAEEFLNLPDPVLVTAMAKHERFFPVRDKTGKILNKFISIRNNGTEASVKAGNEWVLNARFNDARFFYNEDQKRTLVDFLADTEQMLFQDQLGTVRQRADRLANLTVEANKALGGTNDEDARNAGLYAKADLSTGLVSELSSLQGIVGGEYALREGFTPAVAQAIGAQYSLPEELTDQNRLGVALLMADHIDKLAGFLGIGMVPKGSSDPFGLRRSASFIIQASWLSNQSVEIAPLMTAAFKEYANQDKPLDSAQAELALAELFQSRYESLLPEVDHDVHDAAVIKGEWETLSQPSNYLERTRALTQFKNSSETIQTYTRPLNILTAARAKAPIEIVTIDPTTLTPQGLALYKAVMNKSDLKDPIHNFFESTMINDEDTTVRNRNFALLQMVESELLKIGDFTKLVID